MSASENPVRVLMPDGVGPLLVDGPLEVVLPDGTTVRSERPVVALCVCRRSRRYPFCDASHRRRAVPAAKRGRSGSRRRDDAG